MSERYKILMTWGMCLSGFACIFDTFGMAAHATQQHTATVVVYAVMAAGWFTAAQWFYRKLFNYNRWRK